MFDYSFMQVVSNVTVGIGKGYVPLDNTVGSQLDTNAVGLAKNKAYSKFVDQMGQQAQWANNLLERSKKFEGAMDHLVTLTRFTRAIRRLDVKTASKVLGVRKRPRVNKLTKASDLWLKYHFGWRPLVEDIGVTMELLTRDYSQKSIRVRTRNTENSSSVYRNGTQYKSTSRTITTGVQCGGTVRIVNPNISLLADLGFINPASVLWEAVPFSFVVDWFANVGQVFAAYSDFAGKSLKDSYTTVFQERRHAELSGGFDPYGNKPYWPSGYWYNSQSSKGISVQRGLGITGPTLRAKPLRGLSVTRGVTAVALLLQQMTRLQ